MRSSAWLVAAIASLIAVAGSDGASLATGIAVSDAWIRWLPGDLPAAGYATLQNLGSAPVTLTGASTPDYAMAMFHESRTEHDLERMLPVETITIAAHATMRFAPNGYHIMLSQAHRPVQPGDHVLITLHFAGNVELPVSFEVRGPDGEPARSARP